MFALLQVWDSHHARVEQPPKVKDNTLLARAVACHRRGIAVIPAHCGFAELAEGTGLGFGEPGLDNCAKTSDGFKTFCVSVS